MIALRQAPSPCPVLISHSSCNSPSVKRPTWAQSATERVDPKLAGMAMPGKFQHCGASGPIPDLLNQNLHFSKIPGFICTLNLRSTSVNYSTCEFPGSLSFYQTHHAEPRSYVDTATWMLMVVSLQPQWSSRGCCLSTLLFSSSPPTSLNNYSECLPFPPSVDSNP